jgi:hypothetical protein
MKVLISSKGDVQILAESPETILDVNVRGIQGAAGVGAPVGGLPGQIISKKSNVDYDYEWIDQVEALSASVLSDRFIATHPISALKIVRPDSSTHISYATNDGQFSEAQAFGITLNGSVAGGEVNVLFFGKIEDAFFNFPINENIFLNANGEIGLSAGVAGEYNVQIGKSLGNGAMFIDIKEPILM